MMMAAFAPTIGPINADWTVPNPVGFLSSQMFDLIFPIWGVGLLLTIFTSLVSLVVRYRKAHPLERQQIKWLLFALGLLVIYYGFRFVWVVLFSDNGWQNLLFFLLVLFIPIAIAIAVLRYRLYDIDLIIRRTVVYAILTAALGLVYFGSVVVLQTVVGRATAEQSPLVVVFSTLLIAALFSPLRRRIQSFIDRRFFRSKYDAAQMLARFAQTTRDEVDMEALQAELLRVIEETLQPESVAIWLKQGRGKPV
jgi:hypothetical protein